MTRKTDSIGRRRNPIQDTVLPRHGTPGRISRSHNINAAPDVHEAFASLTPVERGELIRSALRKQP